MACVWTQRRMDTYKVRFPQQSRQIYWTTAQGFFCLLVPTAIGVQDAHIKAFGPLGDLRPNPAQANNAESCMVNIVSHKKERSPRLPTTVSDKLVGFGNTASNAQNESKGQICCCFGQHAWRIGQEHATAA